MGVADLAKTGEGDEGGLIWSWGEGLFIGWEKE